VEGGGGGGTETGVGNVADVNLCGRGGNADTDGSDEDGGNEEGGGGIKPL
jgi:hypothetical protein